MLTLMTAAALPALPAEQHSLPRAELRDPGPTVRFMLAGNAHVTFQSLKTDVRYTYRVVAAKDSTSSVSHFVHVLTGPDSYEYLGCIYGSRSWGHGRKSRIAPGAASAKAFAWCWARLAIDHRMPGTLAVYHEGRCGKCGRRLTTPESIQTGLGPVCGSKMGGAS